MIGFAIASTFSDSDMQSHFSGQTGRAYIRTKRKEYMVVQMTKKNVVEIKGTKPNNQVE